MMDDGTSCVPVVGRRAGGSLSLLAAGGWRSGILACGDSGTKISTCPWSVSILCFFELLKFVILVSVVPQNIRLSWYHQSLRELLRLLLFIFKTNKKLSIYLLITPHSAYETMSPHI